MSTGKYIPVHMRNMKTGENSLPSNGNQQQRRPYRKSKWEVEQEQKALEEQKKKEKEEKDMKNCELTDTNFPTLGAPVSKTRVWGGEKSFASMAVEWEQKKKEEDEKKQQKQEEQLHNQYRRHNVPLPQFHNVRRFIEPEDESEEAYEETKPKNQEEEGWVFVDRKKIRREKTVEEKFAEAGKSLEQEDDNTVWGETAPQEHETCWDTRP